MEISQKYKATDLRKFLNKAKIGVMSEENSAFICTILFSLKQSWVPEIPTAATDGENLFINPDWFGDLTPKARIGLLMHEAWHVAFEHMERMATYDHKRFNKAADYVINNMLVANGVELPADGLVDPQYRNMSTEQIYPHIEETEENDPFDGDILLVPTKDPTTGKPLTPSQIKQKKQNIKSIIVKASIQSQMKDEPGSVPGEIERMIEEMTNPKLDWFTILCNYMTAFDKTDYSYQRPNRRFLPDHYLPGLYGESMGELALAFDASGSVSQKEFSHYFGETKYLREMLHPTKTTIIEFDTRINNVWELEKEDTMEDISFVGGGGTNLKPVFEYYKDKQPTVLIIFSDLCCSKITEDPGYPVIWICVDNPSGEVNFGTLIHYDIRYPDD